MFGNLFNEFAIWLMFSVFFGYLAIRLYQPLIVAFIVVGIVLGPSVLGWITATREMDLLAKVGVTLLLFIVGLKLDFHLIRTLGKVSLATGLGQVIFTAVIGYFIGLALGLDQVAAIYVAVALTFSSTIIIIKLLSDKDEIDSLYGRIAVGFLIVQDVVVIIAIITLSSLGIGSKTYPSIEIEIISLTLKGVGFLAVIGLLMRFVLPYLLDQIAKSRELLVLSAIAWAVILAGTAELLGFSKEVGGFLAGVSLASTHYRDALASRLETLRNFLLLFFFLDLGAKLQLTVLQAQVLPAIIFSLFVLIGNPLIVMAIMGYMGYRKRTGFLAGLTVAQISEFSLILAALGENLGHISNTTVGLITLVGLVTIGLSTYMIIYSHVLYEWISPWLDPFERHIPHREDAYSAKQEGDIDVIIFGVGRYGGTIAKILQQFGLHILGVDFDPQKVKTFGSKHITARYGDAEDIEFTKTLPLARVKWIVSTIRRSEVNYALVSALRENNFSGKTALSAYNETELELLKKIGPDLILIPYKDAAVKAAQKLAQQLLGNQRAFPHAEFNNE